MKKFLKLAVSIILVLTTVFALTGCSFDLSFYKKEEATSEKVSEITASINEKISENSPSYYKYEATYKYDYTSTAMYHYNTKYDVKMKVNGDAGVGEVFADIEFKSFYEQSDGQYGRDLLIKYCIVRITDGNKYTDYKLYTKVGDQTYSATFSEMLDVIDAYEDGYLSVSGYNDYMISALKLNSYNVNEYFETVIAYTMAIMQDRDIVDTSDNPFIQCLHDLNKGEFIDTLYDISYNKSGNKLLVSGNNKFKITKTYNNPKVFEKYNKVYTLKINNDGTYEYKHVEDFESTNPVRGCKYNTEKQLKPFTGNIEVPTWVLGK